MYLLFSVCRVAISCLKTITAQFSAYRQELSRQGAGASNIDCISARHHESHRLITHMQGSLEGRIFFLSSVSRQDRTRDKAYLAHIELDFNEVIRCFFVQGLASTGQPSKHISFLRKTVQVGLAEFIQHPLLMLEVQGSNPLQI